MTANSHIPLSTLDPGILSEKYVQAVSQEVSSLKAKIKVVGLIASNDKPSLAYARMTQHKFDRIGIDYVLRQVERLNLEQEINLANDDPGIHGVFIYFPIFKNQQDDYLRNQVHFTKDIEAGSSYWTGKLFANDRLALSNDDMKKALLPCTPLAIIKMLTEIGSYDLNSTSPLQGKTVSVFNRSEVIGRPLAVMLSNDGARVHSFDLNGPLEFYNATTRESTITRTSALEASDIVITGVPGSSFQKIAADEIATNAICINFSSEQNFEDNITDKTRTYIPRVGPMTVAMCMRNTLRLYKNFHRLAP